MNRYGKRCVLYPRVSTEMQVDGYSLEGQKNMLTRFADREEMIVVDTYEDAGKSGKSIEGRPAFQKMLRDIEDGLDIDYILVYKLSRFGRNAADILNSLELVQSYGVNLICIEEGIDSSQTSGKLLISVLSAVAEIERENIIEQTMNGRREKARQGGWNGGFAPYGYTLEDNKLMIEETEAVAIRKIFELYTSSEIGLGGIANQLNLQGIRKIPRQNGTLEDWTGHFIKLILDNPVYCGKIAYGRRTKEKVKGTKNDYQMKRNDDYILTEGQHKGIVSEEVWEKAHAKRLRTGVKQPSKIGRDRVHLLSGLLKCPVCGSPMYTNKHAWTNKDGTYKEIYYYVCSRNRMVRGKHCEYKAMLKKTDIEPMVIEAIREIVRNEEYAQAIKKRIGVQIDTKAVDKELEGYQAKLKEVDLNKTRLEREIDSLPADAKYRERKLHDMTLRLDSLYDVIVELEEKIEDARFRRDAIKQQAITLENIYKIMVNFDCVYNIINDEEKRNVVTALIKEIEIYRNDESEYPLKRIGLNFPVFKDGGEVTELLWDKGNTVEFIVDPVQGGAGTSLNMNANEVIANRAIELLGGEKGNYALVSPNDHVNLGQSTNDVFPSAGRMAARRLLCTARIRLQALEDALEEKARQFDHVVKMGRTQLQDAVPIRLGQEFAAYARAVRRDVARFDTAQDELKYLNLGGTAVGTGLNASPVYANRITGMLSGLSGMEFVQSHDLVDATQNLDTYAYISGILKTCAVSLSKMSNDLRLMSSGPRTGFGEINLPARQNGSSIMPGKVNPVIPEVMNQVSFHIIGADTAITLAAEAGQLELNAFEPIIFFELLQSLEMLAAAVETLTEHCVRGITANEAHCQEQVYGSVGLVTALCPYIGYEKAADIAKRALRLRRPVRQVVLDEGVLDAKRLDKLLDPYAMTCARR